MNAIFDWCVALLVFLATQVGVTYKEINVWIFVIIWPIVTVALTAAVVRQQLRIRRLLAELRQRPQNPAQGRGEST